jgi:putative transposase
MSRRAARASAQLVFHVLNRAIQGTTIFFDSEEYSRFLELAREGSARFGVRVLAYCIMPNHWHFVFWPTTDEGLSDFMRWLASRHALLWRMRQGSRGRGAVYQGRFKAIGVQCDGHFFRLCRYVERNALRAGLVGRAEEWPWGSASVSSTGPGRPALCDWPLPKPADWLEHLNEPDPPESLEEIRRAVRRNVHLGDAVWQESTVERLDWSSGRGRGRPRVPHTPGPRAVGDPFFGLSN